MAITHSVSKHMRLSEPTTKIWMKINPYYQRRRCSPMTLGSGNIRLMRIFAGVLWRRVVKQQWGNRKRVGFHAFRRYVFGTLGNEANIIIQYYLVPCCLSTDLRIHDLEWPFHVQFSIFTIINRVSAIRLHNCRKAIYRMFLLYDDTSRNARKADRENRDPQNIRDPRKDCGSFVDEKLWAVHRRNLNKANISI